MTATGLVRELMLAKVSDLEPATDAIRDVSWQYAEGRLKLLRGSDDQAQRSLGLNVYVVRDGEWVKVGEEITSQQFVLKSGSRDTPLTYGISQVTRCGE